MLALVFFLWVGVCAIFFSLGYLVGYNERTAKLIPTERITGPSPVPPTVSSPAKTTGSQGRDQPAPETSMTVAPPPIPPPTGTSPPSASKEAAGAPPGPGAAVATSSGGSPPAEKTEAPASNPAAAPEGEVGVGFTVQVAATRAKQDAERLVSILKSRGYPVFLISPGQAGAADDMYRVQVGPFTSLDDAKRVRTKLVQEGFKPFIKH